MLAPEFLQILCCPKCRGALGELETPSGLHCKACRLFYAIEQGIPNLLIEDAKPDNDLVGSQKE